MSAMRAGHYSFLSGSHGIENAGDAPDITTAASPANKGSYDGSSSAAISTAMPAAKICHAFMAEILMGFRQVRNCWEYFCRPERVAALRGADECGRPYTLPLLVRNLSMNPVSKFPARKSGSARILRCSGIVV